MQAIRFVLTTVTVFSAALLLAFPVQAADHALDADEVWLERTGVPLDNAGLADFLRSQAKYLGTDFRKLVRQLGSDSFEERETASRALLANGKAALPALDEARSDPDPEIVRRVADCLNTIGGGNPSAHLDQACAVARLLARRAPPDAVATLLTYLPAAKPGEVEEQIWFALATVADRARSLPPALVTALRDPNPSCRAVAACLVGHRGNASQRAAVQKLLADADAAVRLRAAQGLLAGGDTSGVPALVALLEQPNIDLAWQAEELLTWLAGNTAPEVVIGAGGPEARQKCRQAWQAWLGQHGTRVTPALALQGPNRPGLLLACGDTVYVCGCDGRPRWWGGPFSRATDSLLLPGGRFLVTDRDRGVRVLDLAGKVVREIDPDDGQLLGCQRLPDGKVLVLGERHLIQFGPDDHFLEIRRHGHSEWRSLGRGPNGDLIAVGFPAKNDKAAGVWRFDQLDPNNVQEVFSLGGNGADYFRANVEPLPSGNYLVSGRWLVGVSEVGPDGTRVRLVKLPSPVHATRLPSGNLVVASGGRLVEIAANDRVVWEAFPPHDVGRVRVCLPLVRIGFPPSSLDIDNSLAYRGRALKSKDVVVRRQAALALRRLGRPAAAVLPELTRALRDPDREVRRNAGAALERLGPRARPAVRALVDVLEADDLDDPDPFTLALANIGPAAVPELLRTLKDDPRWRVRGRVAVALRLLGEEDERVVPALLAGLRDREARVRTAVIEALGGMPDREVVAALVRTLEDPDQRVQATAALALANLFNQPPRNPAWYSTPGFAAGRLADLALPRLRQLLKAPHREVREASMQALGRLGRRDGSVLPALLEVLQDSKDVKERVAAAEALSLMGANGRPAVPGMIALLRELPGKDPADRKHGDEVRHALGRLAAFDDAAVRVLSGLLADARSQGDGVRQDICKALHDAGPKGKAALPDLIRLLKEEDASAQWALAGIGDEAVPGLIEALKSSSPQARVGALGTLALMGPPGKAAVPVLVELLRDQDSHLARRAARVLGAIGPEARVAVPALLAAPGREFARQAEIDVIEALGRIGAGDNRVVSALLGVLQHKDQRLAERCAAAWGLGLQGAAARAAVPVLVEILRAAADPDAVPGKAGFRGRQRLEQYVAAEQASLPELQFFEDDLRGCALVALSRIGPAARNAVPELIRICGDRGAEPFDRWAAAHALGRIGPDAVPAVAILTEVLRDERAPVPVQVGAVRALAEIGLPARAALPALAECVREGDRAVRQAARAALPKIREVIPPPRGTR